MNQNSDNTNRLNETLNSTKNPLSTYHVLTKRNSKIIIQDRNNSANL